MTASGTCALLIALQALKTRYKWSDGDEVIVPAVTFIATSNIVLQLNMKPVFVDVDPIYYELDPSKMEAAITPRTRCIIPVHLFGHPCDMDAIVPIAQKHGLRIIEDSCETMFTRLHGKSVGAFGDIGCFSTYVAHILTTGVGGLCTTNDPALAITLRSLMNHGRDSIYLNIDDDKGKSDEELQLIIKNRFSFVQMGYSFRVTEMEGALGLAEFEEHEEMMRKRRENGSFFCEKLSALGTHIQVPSIRPGATHSFMMFPIVLKNEPKARLVNYLEQNGIETRDMLPLTNQPFYKEALGLNEDDYPVAKWINSNGFYIASHQGLSEIEREYIVEIFNDYFAERAIQRERSALVLMSKGQGAGLRLWADTLPTSIFQDVFLLEASKDTETPAYFEKKGYRVIQESSGKGALLEKAVSMTSCENIIVMGTDGSDDPKTINSLLIKLKQGNDLVIASRFLPGSERQSNRLLSYRSVGNRFFSFLLSILYNRNITDCNNLFRGFKKSAYLKLQLQETGESCMFEHSVQALASGQQIAECVTSERLPLRSNRKRRNRFFSAFAFFAVLFKQPFRSSPTQTTA